MLSKKPIWSFWSFFSLTLSLLGKNFWQHLFFLFFPRKYDLTFQTNGLKWRQFEQEAQGPQLAHLSETATADMQMACNIFPILLWQGNSLNSFWNILLTRLKCWNFQNVTSKTSHPQCLLPTFENWHFGAVEEAKNRFSRWLPSWISDRNDYSYFLIYKSPWCFLLSFKSIDF